MRHPGLLTPPQVDLGNAIRLALDYAPCGICYTNGAGWSVYDLKLGCGEAEPEFIHLKSGTMPLMMSGVLPIPLTETASEALVSLIKDKLR